MRIWTDAKDFDLPSSVVALGTFDGLHIGHQELIRRAITLAKKENAASVICTFDRHPLSVICPERAPKQLMTLDEKIEKLSKMGADGVLIQKFTPEYAHTDPQQYLRDLTRDMRVRAIVAGFNYTFGDRGRGNAAMIVECAKMFGYTAEIVAPVTESEETVSSTLIRALIDNGEHERARRLLRVNTKDQ